MPKHLMQYLPKGLRFRAGSICATSLTGFQRRMASLKATKPVCAQPTEPVKKEPAAKPSCSAPKVPASKPAPKKVEQKPREPKKKASSGSSKPTAK